MKRFHRLVLWKVIVLAIITCLQLTSVVASSSRGGNNCENFAMIDQIGSRRFWDYQNVTIKYSPASKYRVVTKLGRGGFGHTFIAKNVITGQPVVMKVFRTDKFPRKKMMREIMITQSLCGSDRIVKLLDIIEHNATQSPALIFEYVNNTRYDTLYKTFTPEDVKHYAYQLLEALEYAHDMGIIHKDVKPANLVIDHAKRELKLIDWGLSRFYYPSDEMTVAGTIYYKPPEMYIGFRKYDYRADIWAFGAVFARWIFRTPRHFFQATKEPKFEHLRKILSVLGTTGFKELIRDRRSKFDISLVTNASIPHKPWKEFVNAGNEQYATPDALDLLSKLLVYSHKDRLTAHKAKHHRYFDQHHKDVMRQKMAAG